MYILYTVLVSHFAVMSFVQLTQLTTRKKSLLKFVNQLRILEGINCNFTLYCVILRNIISPKMVPELHLYNMTVHAATKWVRSAIFDAGIDDGTSSLLPTHTVFV